jgi:hypothetical protein
MSLGTSCGGFVYNCLRFRFLRRSPRTTRAISTTSPTPAPIPALAPVESPDKGELFAFAFASVEDVGVAVADEVTESDNVVAVANVAPTNCLVSE